MILEALITVYVLYLSTFGIVSLLGKKIRTHVFGKERYVVHHVHQLLFGTSFFVLAKFSIAYA